MSADLLLAPALRKEVSAFFEPRAAAVDRGEADPRGGLAFLHRGVLAGESERPNGDLEHVARVIATVAWSDLASAFSLWAHRMVLEYLSCGDGAARRWIRPLCQVELVGSTALAGPIAQHRGHAPLALAGARDEATLVLDGRIRWASNLFAPDFVLVSAALVDGALVVFAAHGGTPGLAVDPYPRLVALQATASSSLCLASLRVPSEDVLAERFDVFVASVRPTFLLLQSSFCWGLARRSLEEATSRLRGPATVFSDELEQTATDAAEIAGDIVAATRSRSAATHDVVRLRLDAARLAMTATALEAKVVGSPSFLRDGATARRVREAAFLPIQTPTEAQLRLELAGTAAPDGSLRERKQADCPDATRMERAAP